MNDKVDFVTLDFGAILRDVRRRWALYALVVSASAGAGLARFYTTQPIYRASAVLIPNFSQDSKLSKLASIANKFGVESPVPGVNMADYLEQIIESRSLLLKLADTRYATPSGSETTLFEFLKPAKSPAKQVDTLVYLKKLRDRIDFEKGSSGLVQISVKAATPKMAAGIANQLAAEIDRFAREKNLQTLQNQISYLREQVAVVESQRTEANGKMVNFLKANRGIDPHLSPALYSEYGELKMQVDIANQGYLLLRQELESAQISLFKKEPILMFIDPAAEPYWKWAPKGKVLMAIHVALGFALAGLAHFVAYLRASRRKAA